MLFLTLKINEQTKKCQNFLETLQNICGDTNEIEIIKVPNKTTQKVIDDAKNGIGLNKSAIHEDLMKKLLL